MSSRHPHGLSSYGIPLIGSGAQIPVTTGDYWFVDSGHTNTGTSTNGSKNHPRSTIDGAVNLASSGDVIIVAPGHSEVIASATSLVLDVAGISIVGLGWGHLRPQLTFSATASKIIASVANVKVTGLLFVASVASIVTGVEVTGTDFIMNGCKFWFDATGLEFLVGLDLDTADRAEIIGNEFVVENIAGCNTGVRIDNSPAAKISYNSFKGDYTTAAISGTAGSAAASVDIEIVGNLMENRDTTAGLLIDVHDTGTGIITNNRGFTLYSTNITAPWDSGNALQSENYLVNVVDETGAVVGTPST